MKNFILCIGGILQSAQSFPSLTNSNTPITIQNSISAVASNGGSSSINFNQALAMSLTSASSDSERVSLEVRLYSVNILTLFYIMQNTNEFLLFVSYRIFQKVIERRHYQLIWMMTINYQMMMKTTMRMKMMKITKK